MNIAMVSYMDFTGPGVMHMHHFANLLVSRGHQVLLILNGDKSTADLMHEPPAYDLVEVRFRNSVLHPSLVKKVKEFGPHIIHIWTPRHVPARVGLELKYRTGARLIIHFEDNERFLFDFHNGPALFGDLDYLASTLQHPEIWSYFHPVISPVAEEFADAFTAICPPLVELLQTEWRKKSYLLYPGVDLKRFNPEVDASDLRRRLGLEGKRVILYSGSVARFHDFDILLEAFALMADDHPHSILVHLGRIQVQERVDSMIQELGIGDRTLLLGPIEHREIHRYLALGDFLVQSGGTTSFNEFRLPAKIPEYLAMGKPVITFTAGIGKDLEQMKDVVKTHTADPRELAEQIQMVICDEELQRTLSTNARKRAEELFDWQVNTQRLVDIYEEVLSPRRGPIFLGAQALHPSRKEQPSRLSPGRKGESRRVLVVANDLLPLPGSPTTGAGLRAWGLGQGLISKGHEVIFAMPNWCSRERKDAEAVGVRLWDPDPEGLNYLIKTTEPEVILFCHWPAATKFNRQRDIPVVIDFHGPHILERAMQGGTAEMGHHMAEKVQSISKGDFFTCAGERQRQYFLPWLMMAGIEEVERVLATIPVSLSPHLPTRRPSDELTFVYGGVFLPWQDPSVGLSILVEKLENLERGVLKVFGGAHPTYQIKTGVFEDLRRKLKASPRVSFPGMVPREQLLKEYGKAHVAIDLMARNAERELAFTTRTVEYLWCGLPVIYNDYSELSRYISEYKAGWIVDPESEEEIAKVIDEILSSPEVVSEYSQNAQRLVRERLTWDKTIEPLDRFCRNPAIPERRQRLFFPTPTEATKPSAKTFGMLIDEAIFHYRRGGIKRLLKETAGFIRRRRG